MARIKLPDGSVQEHPDGVTPLAVAEGIGSRLARAALAAQVDGRVVDLKTPLTGECELAILTSRDEKALDVLRHSTAHVMAQAVGELYENVKFDIGPATEEGFYYDFDLPERLGEEDLAKIESRMEEIRKEAHPFERFELSRAEAEAMLEEKGQSYKVVRLHEVPEGESIGFYKSGSFVDLCRGPHLPDTSKLGAFKLTSVAGSYFHGDETQPMLQRVYGTAFFDKKELKAHLAALEEARKRDHRRLGKELDIFMMHPEAPGFPFMLPGGMVILENLLDFWREEHRRRNYREVRTPIILNEHLWHTSGHYDHYRENMYFTQIDDEPFAVKPMNCPGGLLVYKNRPHSYRELPLKMAELGTVHRHEKSGVLHGLMRVRCFTQDDAHIFCTPEQVNDQVLEVVDLVLSFYKVLGFEDVDIEVSTRPEKSIGTDEEWENATDALKNALDTRGLPYTINPGDGAFYGPKIDFHIRDCLGRSWQCATCQLDFSMPRRFELEYIDSDGAAHRPVMIHRVVIGSLERMLGILIEHYGGAFPTWLAPQQVRVLNITDAQGEYAESVAAQLKAAGLRAEADLRNEKIGHKIREATLAKVPYMLVVGDREVESSTVAVRHRTDGDLGSMTVEQFVTALRGEVDERHLARSVKADPTAS
jgi:threonyl-tRNA synthetase